MAKTTLKLNEILQDLKTVGSAGLEKTAGVQPQSKAVATARNELIGALNGAMTKTASAAPAPKQGGAAVNQVLKIAGDLAASEQEALKKEAAFFGAAFMDGAIARLHQYEQATGNVKTASAPVSAEAEFEKFAAENPELVREAVQLGYLHGKQQIEQIKQGALAQQNPGQIKQAEEAQLVKAAQQGYQDTMQELTKLSTDVFNNGYVDTVRILRSM